MRVKGREYIRDVEKTTELEITIKSWFASHFVVVGLLCPTFFYKL